MGPLCGMAEPGRKKAHGDSERSGGKQEAGRGPRVGHLECDRRGTTRAAALPRRWATPTFPHWGWCMTSMTRMTSKCANRKSLRGPLPQGRSAGALVFDTPQPAVSARDGDPPPSVPNTVVTMHLRSEAPPTTSGVGR